ncbi:MAG: hypothetical protein CMH07_02590 [Marinovum sp.]|nr:hypothetical protein [Marinovum sp.]
MVIMLRRTICCFTFFSLAIAGTVVPAQDEPPNPSSVELAAYLRSKTPSTGSECLAYLTFDPPEISIRESCKERIIEIQYDEQLESSMLLRKESVSSALLNECHIEFAATDQSPFGWHAILDWLGYQEVVTSGMKNFDLDALQDVFEKCSAHIVCRERLKKTPLMSAFAAGLRQNQTRIFDLVEPEPDNGTINVQLSQLYTKLMMVDTELDTMALLSQWDLKLPGFHMLTFTLLKSKL